MCAVFPLEDERYYFMTGIFMYVATASDYIEATLLTSQNSDGTGNLTPYSPVIQTQSPAVTEHNATLSLYLDPPGIIRYEENVAEALVLHLYAKNNGTVVSFYCRGWWLTDQQHTIFF